MSIFTDQYALLEEQFRQQARWDEDRLRQQTRPSEETWSVYLPNVPPKDPVDFVFIASHPSVGKWARSREDADLQIARGFKNYLCSIECAILHFCIQKYLCPDGQAYYLTDLSKGAMLVAEGEGERWKRYERWYPLLLQELSLVTRTDTAVFAIGREVERFLRAPERSPLLVKLAGTLVSYSGQAVRHHLACIKDKEDEFDRLDAELRPEQLVETLETVQDKAGWSAELMEGPRFRLRNVRLTDARKALVFCYKTTFETWRRRQEGQSVSTVGSARCPPGASRTPGGWLSLAAEASRHPTGM